MNRNLTAENFFLSLFFTFSHFMLSFSSFLRFDVIEVEGMKMKIKIYSCFPLLSEIIERRKLKEREINFSLRIIM